MLLDKNPNVRTVINKIDDVGTTSEFRTFTYEVLAGDPDMNVEVKEEDCIFRFDYSKVYWNSRLNTEHRRLVEMFQPGEAVCDVMAGVGPFAVPAGKREVFVWANDLNPDSYISLKAAVERNKVNYNLNVLYFTCSCLAKVFAGLTVRPSIQCGWQAFYPRSSRTVVQRRQDCCY